MKRTGILMLALAIALSSVALATTKSDYDHNYNLAKLKTWAFTQPEAARDMAGRNALWAGRVGDDLQQQLSRQGFERTDRAGADFLIAYRLGTKEKVNTYYESLGFPDWHRRGFLGGWRDVSVVNIPYSESTLVIDVIDAKTGNLVWRGYNTRTIDFKKADQTIEKAVEHLTDRFTHDIKKSEKNGCPGLFIAHLRPKRCRLDGRCA